MKISTGYLNKSTIAVCCNNVRDVDRMRVESVQMNVRCMHCKLIAMKNNKKNKIKK